MKSDKWQVKKRKSAELICNTRHLLKGFSLLEMALVLAIASVVIIGGITILNGRVENLELEDTKRKMAAIDAALYNYRLAFNRIPCPGDYTIVPTSASFGIEAPNSTGTCDGGPPSIFGSYTLGLSTVVYGAVPTKTLKLPDDHAFDGWGRRFTYAASSGSVGFTTSGSFITNGITSNGYIGMRDPNNSALASAVYVVLSHGKNGHGAFPREGGSTRITAYSTNTYEQENCRCGVDGTLGTFGGTMVVMYYGQMQSLEAGSSETNTYDDIVLFRTRENLRGLNE